jgi:hypothetical protein
MGDLFDDDFLQRLRKDYLKVLQGKGGNCPCCDRTGKYNAFSITKKNAQALIWIYYNGDEHGWVNTANNAPRDFMRAKTFSNMRYWGLIEPYPNDDKEKRGSGYWRITNKGIKYLKGEMPLPYKAYIYNRTLMGYGEKEVFFTECFKEYFKLDETRRNNFNDRNSQ